MQIATWNIFWLGARTNDEVDRTEEDYKLIADVINRISPDVLALQEIVDPLVMEEILTLANGEGRNYAIRTSESNWLTSDSKPLDMSKDIQKLFICINNETIEFIKGAAIRGGPGGRRPYAVRLRHRATGKEFVVVGLHLRSGFPEFFDEDDAAFRLKEVQGLIRWLGGQAKEENELFPEPDSEDIVVLGDLNAKIDDPNESLAPLGEGSMTNWLWTKPEPDGTEWETALYAGDHLVIDFILLSEALRAKVVTPPSVYAWDYDPLMGGPTKFHSGPNGSGNLKGYEVSDHRPVFTEVEL
jgi:endonuclease/exonuclease/phosphatase family metal-dependent hydrolase